MAKPTGVRLIAIERTRQIKIKNWTAQHDAEHRHGELSAAAVCYARIAGALERWELEKVNFETPRFWPWDEKWWKPAQEPVRNLVKAGALIAAEIDRILRDREIERG